jgi:hypothetical protein
MIKLLNDLLTGKDNQTHDIGRYLWAAGVLVYLGLSIFAIIKGQPWNPTEYGIGLGAVLAGGGAGIALKVKTEPNEKGQ